MPTVGTIVCSVMNDAPFEPGEGVNERPWAAGSQGRRPLTQGHPPPPNSREFIVLIDGEPPKNRGTTLAMTRGVVNPRLSEPLSVVARLLLTLGLALGAVGCAHTVTVYSANRVPLVANPEGPGPAQECVYACSAAHPSGDHDYVACMRDCPGAEVRVDSTCNGPDDEPPVAACVTEAEERKVGDDSGGEIVGQILGGILEAIFTSHSESSSGGSGSSSSGSGGHTRTASRSASSSSSSGSGSSHTPAHARPKPR